ncbi:MAG: malate--CoA ligase subunit beta [Thiotrichales bacterium]|jgi:malate-CoA ligase subunit beta|nr:malate--CoA ligase subunit beta [Thiotrichales bacterium]MBT5500015.1 malate--CoA ligase subunit beta [Thiotrichales bacterium]MBT6008916.1 malate--CoA ligase subunit beta [Rhodobacterales bacterium]
MNIHEYQAKKLLANYGVPIPRGGIAHSATEAIYQTNELGGNKWIVKAQLHSGARGKAGGVKLCNSHQEIAEFCDKFLGNKLVTLQTGPEGKMVSSIYVEEVSNISKELYFSIVLDRATQKVTLVASTEGGMDIEKVAEETPEKIAKIVIDPAVGMQAFQSRQLAFTLDLPNEAVGVASRAVMKCYRAFRDTDANLLEINPLVLTSDNRILAIDAKMTFDTNALYRRPEIFEFRDKTQEDPRETIAAEHDLSYIGLDGNIGCIINGAGLAMATMDMIQHAGGEPANFLDIGGGASSERVATSIELVLSDKNVEAILINIFAGINRCDWVAQGIVDLLNKRDINVPLVVRLSGTNVEKGQKILKDSGKKVITAETLADAAHKVVDAWKSNR